MQFYYTPTFAQAYSQGSYGQGIYNGCTSNQTATGCASGGAGTTGSGLTNTGFLVVIVVTAACLVLLVSILVRFWRRTAKTKLELQTQPEEVEEIDARR